MKREMIEKFEELRKDALKKFYKETDLALQKPEETYHGPRASYYVGLAEAYANAISVLEGNEPLPSL